METCEEVDRSQLTSVYFWGDETGSSLISSSHSRLGDCVHHNMAYMAALHNQVEDELPGRAAQSPLCGCKDCRRSRTVVVDDEESRDRESCCMCEIMEQGKYGTSPSCEDSVESEDFSEDSENDGSKESAFAAYKGVILPEGGSQRVGIKYGVNRFPLLDPQESHYLMMKAHRKEFKLMRGLHRVIDPETGKERMELRDDVSEYSQGSNQSKVTSVMGDAPASKPGFFGKCFGICRYLDKVIASANQFERPRGENASLKGGGASDIPVATLPDPEDMRK